MMFDREAVTERCGICVGDICRVYARAAANTPSASIQFVSQAQLQPGGTALVTVSYECNPSLVGSAGTLRVRLQQPGALGSAVSAVSCDDQKQRLTVAVQPGPFTTGTALAEAVLNGGTTHAVTAQAELRG